MPVRLFAVVLLLLAACSRSPDAQSLGKAVPVDALPPLQRGVVRLLAPTGVGYDFLVSRLQDPADLAWSAGEVRSDGHALLLTVDPPQQISLNMAGVVKDLDVLFFDRGGVLRSSRYMTACTGECPTYSSPVEITIALVVPGNFITRADVRGEWTVQLPD